MKNLMISVLLTKILADHVLVPCTVPQLVGMIVAVFTITTLLEWQLEKLRQQVRRRRRGYGKR